MISVNLYKYSDITCDLHVSQHVNRRDRLNSFDLGASFHEIFFKLPNLFCLSYLKINVI